MAYTNCIVVESKGLGIEIKQTRYKAILLSTFWIQSGKLMCIFCHSVHVYNAQTFLICNCVILVHFCDETWILETALH